MKEEICFKYFESKTGIKCLEKDLTDKLVCNGKDKECRGYIGVDVDYGAYIFRPTPDAPVRRGE